MNLLTLADDCLSGPEEEMTLQQLTSWAVRETLEMDKIRDTIAANCLTREV